jgi:TIR domain
MSDSLKVDLYVDGYVLEGTTIPPDYRIEEIISELVQEMNYPVHNVKGEKITYSLILLRTNVLLGNAQTLVDAGIVNGDAIRLESSEKPGLHNKLNVRRLRVFLCHSSNDKRPVRELFRRLQTDGFDPWLDEENLVPGQDWNKEIVKAVHGSDVVLVCLSQNAINKSGYVQKEIKSALDVADEQPEDTIFLIPIRLEECEVPERLRRWHWVNFFEDNGYRRLLIALHLRAQALGISSH